MRSSMSLLLLSLLAVVLLQWVCVRGQSITPPFTQLLSLSSAAGSGFSYPFGATTDCNGSFYVTDQNARLAVLSGLNSPSPGTTLAVFDYINGVPFSAPFGVAVDVNLVIYVVDQFQANKLYVLAGLNQGVNSSVILCSLTSAFGTSFNDLSDVAVDDGGWIYLADTYNGRIVVLTPVNSVQPCTPTYSFNNAASGQSFSHATSIALHNGDLYVGDINAGAGTGRLVVLSGVNSTVPGTQLSVLYESGTWQSPWSVSVDVNGSVYLLDQSLNNNQLLVLAGLNSTTPGAQIAAVAGSGGNSWDNPYSVWVDPYTAIVVVADTYNGRVVALSPFTSDVIPVGRCATQRKSSSSSSTPSSSSSSSSSSATQFSVTSSSILLGVALNVTFGNGNPTGLVYDGLGHLYVAESLSNAILKMSTRGVNLSTFAFSPSLSYPDRMAIDLSGALYVSDNHNRRVVKFTSNGTQLQVLNTTNPTLLGPIGVAVSTSFHVWVADSANNRIVEFYPNGTQASAFTTSNPSLNVPFGICLDTSGSLFIADTNNNRIVKRYSDGTYITFYSGLLNLQDVTVDWQGNVFISSSSHIVQISSTGTLLQVLDLSFVPFSLVLDGFGNLYASDTNGGRVVQFTGLTLPIPPSSSSSSSSFVASQSSSSSSPIISSGGSRVTQSGSSLSSSPSTPSSSSSSSQSSSTSSSSQYNPLQSTGTSHSSTSSTPTSTSPSSSSPVISLSSSSSSPSTPSSSSSSSSLLVWDDECGANVVVDGSFEYGQFSNPYESGSAWNSSAFLQGGGGCCTSTSSVWVECSFPQASYALSGAYSGNCAAVFDAAGQWFSQTVVVPGDDFYTLTFQLSALYNWEPSSVQVTAQINGANATTTVVSAYNSLLNGWWDGVEATFWVPSPPEGGNSAVTLTFTDTSDVFTYAVVDAITLSAGDTSCWLPSSSSSSSSSSASTALSASPSSAVLKGTSSPSTSSSQSSSTLRSSSPSSSVSSSTFSSSTFSSSIPSSSTASSRTSSLSSSAPSSSSSLRFSSSSSSAPVPPLTPSGSLNVSIPFPYGIVSDGLGQLYVSDQHNGVILKLSTAGNGSLLANLTSLQLSSPVGLAMDSAGALYCLDTGHGRAVKFTTQGIQLQVFTTTNPPLSSGYDGGVNGGVAVDSAFNVWVTDVPLGRVVQFNPNGTVGVVLTQSAWSPDCVGVDTTGVVYICDTGNARLFKWTNSSVNMTVFYTASVMFFPSAITFDVQNNLFVSSFFFQNLLQISPAGVLLQSLQLSSPGQDSYGVALDTMGTLYVTVPHNGQVVRFSRADLLTLPTANGSLCILLYSTPGVIDYPFSIAYSLQLTYDSIPITTSVGPAVLLLSGTGTRTYTNRFGVSFSTAVTLIPSTGPSTGPLLYLNSALPVSSVGFTFNLSSPVQQPGADPTAWQTQLTVYAESGELMEKGSALLDGLGQAFLSSVAAFTNRSISAANINSFAALYATCQAPITFTNGLRPPMQPTSSSSALHFTYSYFISDGVTYSVQTNLSVTTTSEFATLQDQLGNPYQLIAAVTGVRLYTYLAVGLTLTSTVTGIAAVNSSTGPIADQRFYPYALLSSAPGVYSMNSVPFLDGDGLTFAVSPAVPANGLATAPTYSTVTVFIQTNSSQGTAVLAESPTGTNPPLLSLQRQSYSLL